VVHALFEVHEGVFAPELKLDLFPGNDLSRLASEKREQFERLWSQLDQRPKFAQLFGPQIELENSEAENWGRTVQMRASSLLCGWDYTRSAIVFERRT
jgi:hypothetical protein